MKYNVYHDDDGILTRMGVLTPSADDQNCFWAEFPLFDEEKGFLSGLVRHGAIVIISHDCIPERSLNAAHVHLDMLIPPDTLPHSTYSRN